MDVYVGRQPIFDRKMNVYGYELLYRRNDMQLLEGLDDSRATADLINNAFLMMQMNELTHGTKAFINFSPELLTKEIPLLLPKDCVVVEILDRIEPTEEVIFVCKKLKDHGYILTLNDFVFEDTYLPLMEVADIIKIDFKSIAVEQQAKLLARYKNKKTFLAEKIETRNDYLRASYIGYDLFQGFFFCQPTILTGKGIQHVSFNLIRILNELNQEEPDYQKITDIVERDLGLSYKLFRVANSIAFNAKYRTNSMKQALVRIGIVELKKWVYLIMLKEVDNKENTELIRTCLVRAKLMELLAVEMGVQRNHQSFFMTGLFSSMDTLLSRDMASILDELPFPLDVIEALLGEKNEIRNLLNVVFAYETGVWEDLENNHIFKLFSEEKFMRLYVKALAWSMEIENHDVTIL